MRKEDQLYRRLSFTCPPAIVYIKISAQFSSLGCTPLFSKKQETESSTWKIAKRGREGSESLQWQAQRQNQQRKRSIKCCVFRIWWLCSPKKRPDGNSQTRDQFCTKSKRTKQVTHLQEVWCDVTAVCADFTPVTCPLLVKSFRTNKADMTRARLTGGTFILIQFTVRSDEGSQVGTKDMPVGSRSPLHHPPKKVFVHIF